jgi:hypothetical protein
MPSFDADLQAVILVWNGLSDSTRAAIRKLAGCENQMKRKR